jgi:hypothetical protein
VNLIKIKTKKRIEYILSRRPVREEYDFFNNKPQQHRRGPTKETDLDRGYIIIIIICKVCV